MPTVSFEDISATSGKPQAAQGVNGAASKADGSLYEEFSKLLDKISVQLENAEEVAALAPTTVPVKEVKAEQPKQQNQQPQQEAPKEETKVVDQLDTIKEEKTEEPKEVEAKDGENSEEKVEAADTEDSSQSEGEEVVAVEEVESGEGEEVLEVVDPTVVIEEQAPVQEVVETAGEEIVEEVVDEIVEEIVEEVVAEGVPVTQGEEVVEATTEVAESAQVATVAAAVEAAPKEVKAEKPEVPQQPVAQPEVKLPEELASQQEKTQTPVQPQFQAEPKTEAQVIAKEFTEAVQTVAQQTTEAPKQKEVDQLVRAFQNLVQEKVSDLPDPLTSAARFNNARADIAGNLFSSSAARFLSDAAFGKGDVSSLVSSSNQSQSSANNGNTGLGAKTRAVREQMDSEPMQELSKGQELRTLKKVEEALKEVARSRDGKTISLRLDPPSLGSVRVDVSIRDGILHARLAADNSNVNNLLREKGHELQQMLRALGLEVDSVSVSVRDENTGSGNSGQAGDSEQSFEEHFTGDSSNDAKASPNGAAAVAASNMQSQRMDHWVA